MARTAPATDAVSQTLNKYVLACTSDARETFKRDDRAQFIEYAVRVADGRPLIFKLHPNEDHPRAAAEIAAQAPGAKVFLEGSAEEMVANARVVICQYSSLAFVGLALGKEVHSYFDVEELRALMPIQNACAARNIAAVCREILEAEARTAEAAREPRRRADRGRRTTVPAARPPEARPAGGSVTWSGGQSQ